MILIAIMSTWLMIGYFLVKKSPQTGFCFLAFYILVSTHSCLRDAEDRHYTPKYNFNAEQFLANIEENAYEFALVRYQEKEYLRLRSWSDDSTLRFFHFLYRTFLLYGDIPEYIFNLDGKLLAWTANPNDDLDYQETWVKAKEIRVITKPEALQLIRENSSAID